MKGKWLYAAGFLIILGMMALTGCGKKESPLQASGDTAQILAVMAQSGYASADGFGGTNDGTTTPLGFNWGSGNWTIPGWDTLKPVRFARHIDRNLRTVKIDSLNAGKTKAWVTVTHDLSGNFYVNSDPGNPYHIYIRPISDDKWVRHVYLEKNDVNVWRVVKISPVDAQTVNSPYPITILSVTADAVPSGAHYVFTRPDTLLAREELPTFLPGDSVTLTVSVSVQGDSSWAFLHRWLRPFPYWHIRQPFYRTSLTTFQRTWTIPEDSIIYTTPSIRHAAVDLIGMKALFGSDMEQYNAHVWGFLYVVKNPGEPYPD
jgi:hypothetical protein